MLSLKWHYEICGSVQFSRSIVSNTLRPHGLPNARLPCPSPTPGAYSNSCPLSQWCHLTISSSVVPFSSRLQSFPSSESFPMSQFLAKVLEFWLQHQSFQWIFRTDFLQEIRSMAMSVCMSLWIIYMICVYLQIVLSKLNYKRAV